jgi:serine/threonine protein kinase
MGIVHKAEDVRLHRFVALKFLLDEVAKDVQALARFQREAQAASALNHPNICMVLEIDEREGQNFIAMEYLDGMTLNDRIGGRPLEVEAVLSLGIEIADAPAQLCRDYPPRHQAHEHSRQQARQRQGSRFRFSESDAEDQRWRTRQSYRTVDCDPGRTVD